MRLLIHLCLLALLTYIGSPQATTLYTHLLGTDHPNIARIKYQLGLAAGRQGKLEKAKELLRNAAEIRTESLGRDHPDVGAVLLDEGHPIVQRQPRVVLHERHAARKSPRHPSVYVYELWDHTSLILQYATASRSRDLGGCVTL